MMMMRTRQVGAVVAKRCAAASTRSYGSSKVTMKTATTASMRCSGRPLGLVKQVELRKRGVMGMAAIGEQVRTLASATSVDLLDDRPLVIGVSAEGFDKNGNIVCQDLNKLDKELDGAIQAGCSIDDFTGKANSSCKIIASAGSKKNQTVILCGYEGPESDPYTFSTLANLMSQQIKPKWNNVSLGVLGLEGISKKYVTSFVAQLLSKVKVHERFKIKTKTRDEESNLNIKLVNMDDYGEEAHRGSIIATGIDSAMDLVNAPPNVATPSYLADQAKLMESFDDNVTVKVLEKEDCSKYGHGMGLFLGVSQGSDEPPKFIHIKYSNGTPKRKVGLVGKAVTFDSGGLNLKAGPGSMIELMKFDMGGGAAVLGTAQAIAQLKPKDIEIHFVVPCCENMVAGNSLRPGDVICASNGVSVEIGNTDAEGRLILADALLYCQDQGVTEIVDVATLTGACIIALGEQIAGLMSNDDDFAKQILQNASDAQERMWQLPMEKSYRKLLDSKIADMKNVGPRPGGTITAGLFLNSFIDAEKNISFAHMDIAGPVWDVSKEKATGFGVATLVEFLTASETAKE